MPKIIRSALRAATPYVLGIGGALPALVAPDMSHEPKPITYLYGDPAEAYISPSLVVDQEWLSIQVAATLQTVADVLNESYATPFSYEDFVLDESHFMATMIVDIEDIQEEAPAGFTWDDEAAQITRLFGDEAEDLPT